MLLLAACGRPVGTGPAVVVEEATEEPSRPDPGRPPAPPRAEDADGDGELARWAGGWDCDDHDPQRSSTFDELCGNGIDDDCDRYQEECPEGQSLDDVAVRRLRADFGGRMSLASCTNPAQVLVTRDEYGVVGVSLDGDRDGWLEEAEVSWIWGGEDSPWDVICADLDGDGYDDAVTSGSFVEDEKYYYGGSVTTFGPLEGDIWESEDQRRVIDTEWSAAGPAVVGDLDADGIPEVVQVFGLWHEGGVIVGTDVTAETVDSEAGGSASWWMEGDAERSLNAPVIADFDGDGESDLLLTVVDTASADSARTACLLTGAMPPSLGVLADQDCWALIGAPRQLATADIDDDGTLELLAEAAPSDADASVRVWGFPVSPAGIDMAGAPGCLRATPTKVFSSLVPG